MISVLLIGKSPSDCIMIRSRIPDFCTLITIPDYSSAHSVLLFNEIDLLIVCPSVNHEDCRMIIDAVQNKVGLAAFIIYRRDPEQIAKLNNDETLTHRVLLLPEGLNQLESVVADIVNDRLTILSKSGRCRIDQRMSALVGSSDKMIKVKDRILKFSSAPGPVLITGESGTGKEITARLLHDFSSRGTGIFHVINAGSIPAGLSASEFFGCASGAYTGAVRRNGCFEYADGGSLFIDEIAELEPAIQAELLRVLESGRVRKIGANEIRNVDVRLISATNKKLVREAEAGRFRRDLLYRIDMFRIHIPPLRERKEDIPDLLIHFGSQLHKERPDKQFDFSDSFLDKLFEHQWPGNVRELRNIFRRAVYSSDSELLTADSIWFDY